MEMFIIYMISLVVSYGLLFVIFDWAEDNDCIELIINIQVFREKATVAQLLLGVLPVINTLVASAGVVRTFYMIIATIFVIVGNLVRNPPKFLSVRPFFKKRTLNGKWTVEDSEEADDDSNLYGLNTQQELHDMLIEKVKVGK